MQHATDSMQHATDSMQHATDNMQQRTDNMQQPACNMQQTACNMQQTHATDNMRRATCGTLLIHYAVPNGRLSALHGHCLQQLCVRFKRAHCLEIAGCAGPDGDLGSNEILISKDKTVGIVDGSGTRAHAPTLRRTRTLALTCTHTAIGVSMPRRAARPARARPARARAARQGAVADQRIRRGEALERGLQGAALSQRHPQRSAQRTVGTRLRRCAFGHARWSAVGC